MKNQEKQKFISKLKGMGAEDLTAVIHTLEQLSEKDIFPNEIFPEGIITKDGARARFILSPEKHRELMEIINANPHNPIFKDMAVFPLGIIKPRSLRN